MGDCDYHRDGCIRCMALRTKRTEWATTHQPRRWLATRRAGVLQGAPTGRAVRTSLVCTHTASRATTTSVDRHTAELGAH